MAVPVLHEEGALLGAKKEEREINHIQNDNQASEKIIKK